MSTVQERVAGPSWRNPKHRDQWRMTLTRYCEPLSLRPVDSITTDDVLGVLRPLWLKVRGATLHNLRGVDIRIPLGHWEAKDTDDSLDREIARKLKAGYPQDNIIFENSVSHPHCCKRI